MRNLTPRLQNHLKLEVTTLAACWKLERMDGFILGFTDHDQPLEIDGMRYDSIAGFTPSNVESGSTMAIDNLDIAGSFYESKITKIDLLAGKYDFARIEVFLVNYNEPNAGKLVQKTGIIGEVTVKRNLFFAEIRGLSQFLSQTLRESYSPHCRTQVGDNRCKFNLAQHNYTVESAISQIIDQHRFIANNLSQEADWFKYGYLSWQTGNNAETKMEIKDFANQQVTLALPMPFAIQLGDMFTIVAGCDKSKNSCINKFNNIINFRGEPDLPGTDRLMSTAGTI